MEETSGDNAKLHDFERNPSYERKVVIFYDVLGWRNHIKAAGDDTKAIGGLRRVMLRYSRSLPLRTSLNLRVTTFSDNVVISQDVSQETPLLITLIAFFQIAGALSGFFLRGGITIGGIVHDNECVFGPGLNRAYELEKNVAKYPRIVLDRELADEFGNLGDLALVEDDTLFLDPFRTGFVRHMQNEHKVLDHQLVTQAGLPINKRKIGDYDPELILKAIHKNLKREIRSPIGDREYEKIAWLFNRISKELGVPPASSYPRNRSGESP
jgi:hypothetical protein